MFGKYVVFKKSGCSLVRSVNIVYSDDGQVAVIAEIPKSDAGAWLDGQLVNGLLG